MRFPILPRPSTRAFMREARRTSGYTLFDWLHGYVYARWPYLYIGIGTGEHPLSRVFRPIAGLVDRLSTSRPLPPSPGRGGAGGEVAGRRGAGGEVPPRAGTGGEVPGEVTFADTYHGKVVTLDSAKKLVAVDQDIDLGDLEHIVPYALARDIVLKNPDHIVALECPCRAARANPCVPLDVCLIVGEPFASFVAEHHGRRSRWITSDEAAEILAAEHERGHVHHAFFKDAMLGRFYAICNCCSCCCGAMQAQRNGVPMLAASGYVCVQDAERCIGCGTCASLCQFDAIVVDGTVTIDREKCMGCGVCVDSCPEGALSLTRDETKGIPLELDLLMQEAARCAPQ